MHVQGARVQKGPLQAHTGLQYPFVLARFHKAYKTYSWAEKANLGGVLFNQADGAQMGMKEPRSRKHRQPEELVITPGGWRPKSKVHYVEPGQHIDGGEGRLKIIDTATGEVVQELGKARTASHRGPKKGRAAAGTGDKGGK